MRKTFKAAVSIIFSAIFLLSLVIPGYAKETKKIIPTILVAGQGSPLTNQDGVDVYPLELKSFDKDFITNALNKLNPTFLKGYVTGDYSDYCDAICEILDPVFAPFRLDENGEDPNGLSPRKSFTVNAKEQMYRFNYDWRMDPIETADKLNDYIDFIIDKTGSSKVNIIGRCLGANIVTSYISGYGVEKLNKYLIYCGVLWGTELCSSLFKGSFNLSADGVESFALNSLENDFVMNLIKGSVSLLNKTGGLNLAADFVNKIYDQIKDDLVPRLVLLMFGTMPSYWSMVAPWDYDEAKAFVFSDGREVEYVGLIRKIDNYHEKIQLCVENILKEAESQGLVIGNICKYGRVLIPVVEDVSLNADEMVSVYVSSLGATSNAYDQALDSEYIQNAKDNGTYKYISPDKQVDASTCMFPENTWFVKNVGHRNFPSCIETDIMIPFFRYDGEMTVDSDKNIPQFMVCDDEANTVAPMTQKNARTEGAVVKTLRMLWKNIYEGVKALLIKLHIIKQ